MEKWGKDNRKPRGHWKGIIILLDHRKTSYIYFMGRISRQRKYPDVGLHGVGGFVRTEGKKDCGLFGGKKGASFAIARGFFHSGV